MTLGSKQMDCTVDVEGRPDIRPAQHIALREAGDIRFHLLCGKRKPYPLTVPQIIASLGEIQGGGTEEKGGFSFLHPASAALSC